MGRLGGLRQNLGPARSGHSLLETIELVLRIDRGYFKIVADAEAFVWAAMARLSGSVSEI